MQRSLVLLMLLASCASSSNEPSGGQDPMNHDGEAAVAEAESEPEWVPLFNGRDLDGWTPKFAGLPLGENHANTFRVEDGLLRVSYDDYESFEGRFGHLFFEQPFTYYDLRITYRFVGEQTPGGAGWARRNSGAMLHCQDPATMSLDQNFPVSIEAQFLGEGEGSEARRPTANLCTPGTHVMRDGALFTQHCVQSISETYRGDEWVTLVLEVRGHESIRHVIDGIPVLEYTGPQLDPGDKDAKALLAAGAPKELAGGWISLQAESHGIDFKSVEVREVAR